MRTNRVAHEDSKCPFIAFYFWQNWTEWFSRKGRYNWRNFTVLKIAVEDNTQMSGYFDVTLGLIGFNVIIGLRVHKDTEIKTEIMTAYREAVEDGTIELPEGTLT